jgi:hypothetical protein
LLSKISTAMMGSAPTSAAPWMQFNPTPPQPKTATLRPASTWAVLTTAPTPVSTPQPTSAACCSGIVFVDGNHHIRGDDGVGSKGAQPQHLVHGSQALVVQGTPGFVRRQIAEVGEALLAHSAEATVALPREDHVVAGADAAHVAAHRLDDASAFVAQNRGHGNVGPIPFDDMPV